jgi:hypothetical protein
MWCLTSVYLGLGIRTRLIWLVVAGARGRPSEGGRGTRASRSASSSHPTQKSRPAQQQAGDWQEVKTGERRRGGA